MPGTARADSAPPIGYSLSRDGQAVTICADSSAAAYTCGGGGHVLRVAADGSTAYVLADSCVDTTWRTCWLDPCVPPGDWRYGLVDPLPCSSTGTMAWEQIHVDSLIGWNCAAAPEGGTPWDGVLPWDDQWVCKSSYHGPFSCDAGRASVPTLVVAIDLLLAAAGVLVLRFRRRSRP